MHDSEHVAHEHTPHANRQQCGSNTGSTVRFHSHELESPAVQSSVNGHMNNSIKVCLATCRPRQKEA